MANPMLNSNGECEHFYSTEDGCRTCIFCKQLRPGVVTRPPSVEDLEAQMDAWRIRLAELGVGVEARSGVELEQQLAALGEAYEKKAERCRDIVGAAAAYRFKAQERRKRG